MSVRKDRLGFAVRQAEPSRSTVTDLAQGPAGPRHGLHVGSGELDEDRWAFGTHRRRDAKGPAAGRIASLPSFTTN